MSLVQSPHLRGSSFDAEDGTVMNWDRWGVGKIFLLFSFLWRGTRSIYVEA